MTEVKPLGADLLPQIEAMQRWLEYCEMDRKKWFDELFYIPNWVIIKPDQS